MATIYVQLNTSTDAKTTSRLETAPDARTALNKLVNYAVQFMSGAKGRPGSYAIFVGDNTTAATGTVTCTGSASNNVTVSVGGITFTGKTGTPSGSTQFKVGVSATADGLALANAINAHTTTSQYVSAVNASGTVTLTAINYALGVLGNALILSSSDGTNMAVSAFSGGAADSTAVSYTL
jgi:hypothetical protein